MQKSWFFKRWFFQGLIITLPIVITAVVFYYCILYTDAFLWFLVKLLPFAIPAVGFPGMGLLLFTTILILTGSLTESLVLNKLIQLFNYVMTRLPVIRSIYSTVLQVSQNILGGYEKFSTVVLIEYPTAGVYAIAFKTNDAPTKLNNLIGEELISVFLPMAPIPTGGFYLLVPKSKTMHTDLRPEEAFKMIISAGIVTK